jgi:hypothetical protein
MLLVGHRLVSDGKFSGNKINSTSTYSYSSNYLPATYTSMIYISSLITQELEQRYSMEWNVV